MSRAGKVAYTYLLLLAVFIAGLPVRQAFATIDAAEQIVLLKEANETFKEGMALQSKSPQRAQELFKKSVLRYERLRREAGIENSKLYYNLGNAYFRMNRLGEAILNYRKALKLAPGDENILHNLEYARSQRIDKFPAPTARRFFRTLLFWHYDFSFYTRLQLFVGVYWSFWLLAGLRLIRKDFVPAPLVFILGMGLAFISGSLVATAVAESFEREGVIIAESVPVRTGDGFGYSEALDRDIHSGTEFSLLDRRDQWWYIELTNGLRGWIPQSTAALF